ncbi:hypothetical protein WN943_026478 [Citrus x changshan-huyou]
MIGACSDDARLDQASFITDAACQIVCASVPTDRWGELESGQTTKAFTRLHQHETDELTGSVQTPSSPQRQPIEVCFAYADVDAAYKRAVENGAVPVSEPEDKEWGQKVAYVRDINGIVVRMGSYVQASK